MVTAKQEGKGMLLLEVANPEVKLVVPKAAAKAYKEILAQGAGEYAEVGGTGVYAVEANRMPSVKNIVGVKSFTKYE